MAKNQRAALLEMFAVAQRSFSSRQDFCEQPLAFDQRGGAEIVAVAIEDVEKVESESVAASLAKIALQRGKIRRAVAIFDDKFAIEHCGIHRKLAKRIVHVGAESLRPVEPIARQQRHLAGFNPRLQTIAVELDLMQPSGRNRRLGRQ